MLSSSAVSAATVEIVENHELIPAFGTEDFEINKFDQVTEKERLAYSKAQNKIDITEFIQRLLLISLPVSITLFLIFSDTMTSLTPGSIASIFSFTLILTNQIGDFGKGVLAGTEISERLNVALKKSKNPSQIKDIKSYGHEHPQHWDIEFNNVAFSYGNDGSSSNLSEINLKIKENEKIGVVGFSGAGKTTLLKLLRGYYRPDSGQVSIGGIDLKSIHNRALTQNISEVSQSIPLFHRSIRENVAYGCEEISDEEIWKILEKAQISEFVKKLPNGLDTIVGVRGQKLSGGEKARIGIARALIRKSKIILFDEATASLDSDSGSLIQQGLSELIKDRTFIAIAHRLSTLRQMDRIILMEKGKIIADGTHESLIQQNKVYKRLWETQSIL